MSDDLRERLYAVRVLLADSTVHLQDEDEILEARAAVADAIDLLAGTPERPEDDFNQTALEVLCRVFEDGADAGFQEWLAWYKPEQWFHPSRALGAFIWKRQHGPGVRILAQMCDFAADTMAQHTTAPMPEFTVKDYRTIAKLLRASTPEAMPCPRCQRGDPCPDNDALRAPEAQP